MSIHQKIKAFEALGNYLADDSPELNEAVQSAALHNKWFTPDNIAYALKAIAGNYLNAEKLEKWLSAYKISDNVIPKKTGIVMAGNIPLAGFHDLLCVLASGHTAMIKRSSKDAHLLPHVLEKLCSIEPRFKNQFLFVERLKDFDAVIATGSDNAACHFEYYFGKYPRIIRRNRNAVAILTGNETKAELMQLGDDVFLYFGLGCRSVSKLYVPENYDFSRLLEAFEPFSTLMMHHGYKSNFDYNFTLFIMNKTPYIASGFLMLKEDTSLMSPIATLNYEYYSSLADVLKKTGERKNEIQCIVSGNQINGTVAFGHAQQPGLTDYADNVDTLQFLMQL